MVVIDMLGPFPTAPGQIKYLIIEVNYFAKWIEVEALSKITTKNAIKFFKKSIGRFGIPEVVVTDNDTQFLDENFRGLMADLSIKHHFTSVEHPQSNGQAESTNRDILKGNWVEELPHVLWAYRTTPHSTTGESPF